MAADENVQVVPEHMMIVMAELLLAGLAVLFVAMVIIRRMWITHRRKQLQRHRISEAEARANAAPLTAAMLGTHRGERTRRVTPFHKQARDSATADTGPAKRAAHAERGVSRRISDSSVA
jgi:hypothetical protein